MKKALTVNLKDTKIIVLNSFEKIIKNRRKLILTVLSVFGIWCGTKIYTTEPATICKYLSAYAEIMTQQHITEAYIILLVINILPIIITITNGFFAFGTPIITISPYLSGVFIGIINAWSFNVYRLNGVFFSLLSVIPFAVIIIIMLINSSNESMNVSKKIAKSIFLKETGDRGEVKEFFIKQSITIALIIIITLLQVAILKVLYNKLLFI